MTGPEQHPTVEDLNRAVELHTYVLRKRPSMWWVAVIAAVWAIGMVAGLGMHMPAVQLCAAAVQMGVTAVFICATRRWSRRRRAASAEVDELRERLLKAIAGGENQ